MDCQFLLLKNKLPTGSQDGINKIISRCYNVLSLLYTHIYFPTYTNGLKDIGNYIGFCWTEKNASGIESIYWRKLWEATGNEALKKKLVVYNSEDCKALMALKDVLDGIIENTPGKLNNLAVKKAAELQKEQKTIFIANQSFLPK